MSYYITIHRNPSKHQVTFDDIFNGIENLISFDSKDTRDTFTWKTDYVNYNFLKRVDFNTMRNELIEFTTKYRSLIETKDKRKFYYSFRIPKRSGGLRQIDAPNEELKMALYELKHILEKRFYMSYHTSSFAYVRGRSTIDAVKRHQQNNSRWFLKLDMRHFFPSTTPDFLYSMLIKTFPICEFVKRNTDNEKLLREALSLCFFNGGLPQGTPTSPMLTNAMMIPIDHAISKFCRENTPALKYTRYADDILISSKYSFKWTEVRNEIEKILKEFNAPFVIHPEKTRYGSSAGRNWNLGVMLNNENKITIGHEKKKVFKAMTFQFASDYAKGRKWSVDDVQHYLGLVSYYRMVEGKSIDDILLSYSKKFGINVEESAKEILRS